MKLWSKGLESSDRLSISIAGHCYEVFFGTDVDSRGIWMDNGQHLQIKTWAQGHQTSVGLGLPLPLRYNMRAWWQEVFKETYVAIKNLDVEDFSNFPPPESGGRRIPLTRPVSMQRLGQISECLRQARRCDCGGLTPGWIVRLAIG